MASDLFQAELSNDANRTFSYVIHVLKTEAKDEYTFWFSWFKKRGKNKNLQKFLRKKR